MPPIITPVNLEMQVNEYYIQPKMRRKLDGIIETIENIEEYGTKMGNRNYLFTGPPGTGKTLCVQYVAQKLNATFYSISDRVMGQAQDIPEIFAELRRATDKGRKKVIVFLDEIDGLASRKEIVDPLQGAALSKFLSEMDGVKSNEGIFFVGATNEPDKLDDALRRRGRFSKEIEFMPPDYEGRLEILKIHANAKGGHKFQVNPEDLEYVAKKTYGFTGADLAGLLDNAFEESVHQKRQRVRDKRPVLREDLDYALQETKPSAIRNMPFVEPRRSLDDVAGYEWEKAYVKMLVEKANKKGKGIKVLLHGPEGTGKSLLPEAIAKTFGYNLIVIHGNEPEGGIVGETKDRLKYMIDHAKQLAPCVLLFDEIGSLVSQKTWTGGCREGPTGYLQSVLTDPPDNVYIFATENKPEMLTDPFMARFVHKIELGMPSEKDQIKIWKKYVPEGIDELGVETLAKINPNLSCRDISNICEKVNDVIEFSKDNPPSVDYYVCLAQGKQKGSIENAVDDFRKLKEMEQKKKKEREVKKCR